MSVVEFIGFVVSIIAMFFLIIKRVYDEIYRRRNPEKYEEEEELKDQRLKEFMRTMHIEDDEEERMPLPRNALKPLTLPPPTPKQIVKSKKAFKNPMESYKRETAVEKRKLESSNESRYGAAIDDAYQFVRRSVPSRAEGIINTLPSRRDMLVIHEIFGKPLAMRNPTENNP